MCGSRVVRLVTENLVYQSPLSHSVHLLSYGFEDKVWTTKKLFIHMTTHKSLFCHLKPNNHMLIDGFYLLLPLGWMKKTSINSLKIIVHF
jgi:hypothetical protein